MNISVANLGMEIYSWLLFFLGVIFVYFIPGLILTNFLAETKRLVRWPLAIIVGLVFSTAVSFWLGLFGWRDITYVIAAGLNLYWLWQNKLDIKKYISNFHLKTFLFNLISQLKKIDSIAILIVLIGTVMALQFNWNFGQISAGQIHFCCSGVPDTIYHLALTSELKVHMPPMEPGMANTQVSNYHYWSNLAMANMARLSRIEINWLVVRMFPLLLLIMLGLGFSAISQQLAISQIAKRLLLIMVYFFGELTYLLRLLTTHVFRLDLQFNDNALALPVGPPRLFSIVIAVWSIYLLSKFIKKPSHKLLILTGLCIASLTGFKIYTLMIFMGGLCALCLWALIKRHWYIFLLPILTTIVVLAIYLPVTKLGANGFILTPPYNIHNFIETPQLGLVVLELRLQVFEQYHNIPKILFYETGFIAIYCLVIYGWLNFGFLAITVKKLRQTWPFFYGCFGMGLLLGIFTAQKVGGLNTTQFLMTLPYYLMLPAALVIEKLVSQIRVGIIRRLIYILIVGLLISQSILSYLRGWPFSSSMDSIIINQDEVSALSCIKYLPHTGLLAVDPVMAKEHVNLYLPLLTHQPIYIAGVYVVLSDHGIQSGLNRYTLYKKIYDPQNPDKMEKEFNSKNVKYLYAPKKDTSVILRKSRFWQVVCDSTQRQVLQFNN